MTEFLKQLQEANDFIRSKTSVIPEVAIVLGSGLGEIVNEVAGDVELNYAAIPHFPVSTVKGHEGKLILGRWNGKNVVVMAGRFHYYEGYSLQQVTFPIRIARMLGAHTIFLTNATGGLNPNLHVGDLLVVTDHINLNSDHPLRGKNYEELGPRFPDQTTVYDKELIGRADEIALEQKIELHKGVYIGVTGPSFETPAEYKYMRLIGGDVVGMSTVPEAIVANHAGLRTFCISVICDEGNALVPQKITHDEVVMAARDAEPKVAAILKELLVYT